MHSRWARQVKRLLTKCWLMTHRPDPRPAEQRPTDQRNTTDERKSFGACSVRCHHQDKALTPSDPFFGGKRFRKHTAIMAAN